MSVFNAPFLTAEDLRTARRFADSIQQPQDDMPTRWIRALVATVEHERAECDQQRCRAEAAEAELDVARQHLREAEAELVSVRTQQESMAIANSGRCRCTEDEACWDHEALELHADGRTA